jgi:hypothetical protein
MAKLVRFVAACSFLLAASLDAAEGTQATVNGWVLDSACAFTKGLTKPISRDCALACAKAGSPLVILQSDGSIYWPIADSMPASGQNSKLTPFAGKQVTATGLVYTRGGSKALVIESIKQSSAK